METVSFARRRRTGPLRRLPALLAKCELMILGRVVNARKPDTPPRTNRSVKRRRDESCTWRHDRVRENSIEAQTPPPRLTPWGDVCDKHSVTHAPRHIPEAQDAFKGLMIHWILQFALRIAFRCVLHRCESQDIHC